MRKTRREMESGGIAKELKELRKVMEKMMIMLKLGKREGRRTGKRVREVRLGWRRKAQKRRAESKVRKKGARRK